MATKPKVLSVSQVNLETLRIDPRNARRHPDANRVAVRASLLAFGQTIPIVATKSGTVVAGNLRLEIMRELGWRRCSVATISDADARAYALADNRTAELAEWDDERLLQEIIALDLIANDELRSAVGFTPDEIDALIADVGETVDGGAATSGEPKRVEFQASSDPADVEVQGRKRSKVGDVWTAGDHRVVCGDSMDDDTITRLLGSDRVDSVITDPPYAIFGSATGVAQDIADDGMVRPFFERIGELLGARLKLLGHAYVFCDWRSWSAVFDSFRRVRGIQTKNMLVWDKNGAGLGSNYAMTHELVAFVHRDRPPKTMDSSRTERAQRKADAGGKGTRVVLRPNVLRHPRVTGEDRLHNAAKPVAMLRDFLEASTDPGESVADFFGGSGSTLIAAEQTGRRAFIVEREPRLVDVILARWEKITGKTASKATGRTQ